MNDRFLLGINYWPRRTAMYMWQRFDLGEMREDFARIRSLGLDVVRFFLMWEAFQPARDRMDNDALRRLVQMTEAIGDTGLQAMPTLFCGHMSGVNWLPAWALDPQRPHGRFRTMTNAGISPYGIGDFYANPDLLDAQILFAHAAGECIREHPALLAWDLGNEFSNMRAPEKPDDAATWSARLSEALERSSGRPTTAGMHGEDLDQDRNIRPSSIAKPWPYATMHGYPVYGAFARGNDDPDYVPYLMQLESTFAGKPVLFTELGNPTCAADGSFKCVSEDAMPDYAYAVIDRVHARGGLGAFWWCWADYAASLEDVPPFDCAKHELHFGIVRNDGTFKPVAAALQRIAAEGRRLQPPQPLPIGEAEFYSSLPQGIAQRYRDYCAYYS